MQFIGKKFTQKAAGAISLLWFYAAGSKWMEFRDFQSAMHKQELWSILEDWLIYGLPPLEFAIALSLLFDSTLISGLYASAGLLLSFTVYVVLVLFHVFGK